MTAYIRYISAISIILIFMIPAFAMNDDRDRIIFHPVEHSTMVIQTEDTTIYLDPVGNKELYKKFSEPDIILLTDIHQDHLSPEMINYLKHEKTVIVGPKAAIEILAGGEIMNNGESRKYGKVNVEAIPMYNLTKERRQYHEKGRGNGYVLTLNRKRVYISGDTEDIKEMRGLKNIDYAFVCMNLPYTMTVDQAASAVLEFRPKVVIPYHYRGNNMFSDINRFKRLVSVDKGIEVRFMQWYK